MKKTSIVSVLAVSLVLSLAAPAKAGVIGVSLCDNISFKSFTSATSQSAAKFISEIKNCADSAIKIVNSSNAYDDYDKLSITAQIVKLKIQALNSLGVNNKVTLQAFRKAKALADYARNVGTFYYPVNEDPEEISE